MFRMLWGRGIQWRPEMPPLQRKPWIFERCKNFFKQSHYIFMEKCSWLAIPSPETRDWFISTGQIKIHHVFMWMMGLHKFVTPGHMQTLNLSVGPCLELGAFGCPGVTCVSLWACWIWLSIRKKGTGPRMRNGCSARVSHFHCTVKL